MCCSSLANVEAKAWVGVIFHVACLSDEYKMNYKVLWDQHSWLVKSWSYLLTYTSMQMKYFVLIMVVVPLAYF